MYLGSKYVGMLNYMYLLYYSVFTLTTTYHHTYVPLISGSRALTEPESREATETS